LALLLSDAVLRENAGLRGKARILRECLWEEVAKATEAIYLTVAKAPQKKSAVQKKAVGTAA
jgi:hypothetical protein